MHKKKQSVTTPKECKCNGKCKECKCIKMNEVYKNGNGMMKPYNF